MRIAYRPSPQAAPRAGRALVKRSLSLSLSLYTLYVYMYIYIYIYIVCYDVLC